MARGKEMNNYIPKPNKPRPIYPQRYVAVLDVSTGILTFAPDDKGDWEFDGKNMKVRYGGE